MTRKPTRVSRRVLYEAIWETPPEELALRLGIEPKVLTKACEDLQVPRPTNDYWARKAAALPVVKRRMLPPSNDTPAQVTFQVPTHALFPRNLHPLVAKLIAQRALRAQRGWEPAYAPGERRRLAMMSRLFHAVEGNRIHPSIGDLNDVAFITADVRIECRIWMKLQKADAPLSEHARKRLPYRLQHRNLVSSGKLAFEFNTIVSRFGVRRLWSEALGRRFESMVPDIASAISVIAKDARSRRVNADLASREAAQIRALHQRQSAEDVSWKAFLSVMDAQEGLGRARQLIDALERASMDPQTAIEKRTVGEWLSWLRTRLESSEPSTEDLIAVLRRIAEAASEVR